MFFLLWMFQVAKLLLKYKYLSLHRDTLKLNFVYYEFYIFSWWLLPYLAAAWAACLLLSEPQSSSARSALSRHMWLRLRRAQAGLRWHRCSLSSDSGCLDITTNTCWHNSHEPSYWSTPLNKLSHWKPKGIWLSLFAKPMVYRLGKKGKYVLIPFEGALIK